MAPSASDWTAEDQRGLDRELARDERYRFLWLVGAGAIIYPIGGILDWLDYPHQLRFFLTVRAIGTLAENTTMNTPESRVPEKPAAAPSGLGPPSTEVASLSDLTFPACNNYV